jgi:gluconolactonase
MKNFLLAATGIAIACFDSVQAQNGPMVPVVDDPTLPRVLLIGDSISIGYTVGVREALHGIANVHRPLTNCGPTTKGLEGIEDWLGDRPWDVIHFNFGLHDLKYMGPDGGNLADPEGEGSKQQVPLDAYEANIAKLVDRLKRTGAELIWRNTTPVPEGAKGRVVGDSAKYNDSVRPIMEENGIEIDDMFAYSTERLDEIMRKANVHFTPEGSTFLAGKVSEKIKGALVQRFPDRDPEFVLGRDSKRQKDVPKGTVTQHVFSSSKIFSGTVRDYWVYVPSQYDAAKPACVMVFQDGRGYVSEDGQFRVPVVFDNLIHKKQMPVTIAVCVNPGVVPAPNENAQPRFNRSLEYDGLGDRYVRFLLEELLPEVGTNFNLSDDPNDRAIAGASSGAIAAFTAAWERPDAFRRVYSMIGTFVGLRGGDAYPTLVRKTEPKPIRLYLQDGNKDLNIYGGDWWVANLDMLSALEFSGYDLRHTWGGGGHSGKQGGAILPEVIRWLWRDYPEPVKAGVPSDRHPLSKILIPGEDWELVSEGHRFTEGPAVNENGEFFFTDIPSSKIFKVGADGKVGTFAEDTNRANGLMLGADGRLYACQMGRAAIVAYDASGDRETVVDLGDAGCNDLVVQGDRGYFTDPRGKKVWFVDPELKARAVDEGIERPNGIILSPDQTLLYVADSATRWVYSFQVQADGSLAHKQKYFHLHVPDDATGSGADGLTIDTEGRLYVASSIGLQICDQPGRVNAILPLPKGSSRMSNVVFGGPDFDTLYATCGDKVYKRKTKSNGVLPWKAPIKPPKPRL